MSFCSFIQYLPKFFAVFSYESFFQELVYGHFQFLSKLTCGATKTRTRFIIDHLISLRILNSYWKEMTTNRLFPIRLSIVIRLFKGAFDNTLFISESICAHLATNSGRDPSKFTI